ncbi:pseudouridine synthase [Paraburkholderia kururiensis]|uniref:pseudouridine synthase n=1 Tax=Paraburkholderia kururiensis TaxID=984307 RepID=UPI0009E0B428|nr:pseudouridine synthase [Paraburkholderia kururiensis]
MRVKLTAKHPRPTAPERTPVRSGSATARKPSRPATATPPGAGATAPKFAGAKRGAGPATGTGPRSGAKPGAADAGVKRPRPAAKASAATGAKWSERAGDRGNDRGTVRSAGAAGPAREGGRDRAASGPGAPRASGFVRADGKFKARAEAGGDRPSRPRAGAASDQPTGAERRRAEKSGFGSAGERKPRGPTRDTEGTRRAVRGTDGPRTDAARRTDGVRGAAATDRPRRASSSAPSSSPRRDEPARGFGGRGRRSDAPARDTESRTGRFERPPRAGSAGADHSGRPYAKPVKGAYREDRREGGDRGGNQRSDRDRGVATAGKPARRPSTRAEAAPAKAKSSSRPEAVRLHEDEPGTLRLSKRMSELGLCSRREADEWIEKGWVLVDGVLVDTLGAKVHPEQQIEINPAARAAQARQVTILLHKPVGFVSGQAEDGYPPAATLVTPANHWDGDRSGIRFSPLHLRTLAPAGRLDIDSTGLLVLTQDGRVAKQLIGEQSDVDKEYLVRVTYGDLSTDIDQHFPAESLAMLRHGLALDDVPLKPAMVSWQNGEQLRFVLREGKKRQIRRMCELVGLKVVGLKRVRMGRVTLGALPQGQWRYMTPDESF